MAVIEEDSGALANPGTPKPSGKQADTLSAEFDRLIELYCRQEYETSRPYGRVTRNIVTPEFVTQLAQYIAKETELARLRGYEKAVIDMEKKTAKENKLAKVEIVEYLLQICDNSGDGTMHIEALKEKLKDIKSNLIQLTEEK